MKIDMHSHFFPRIDQREAATLCPRHAPWLHTAGRSGQIMVGEKPFRPVDDVLWDSSRRTEYLDEKGVDVQVMCATPVMFGYEQPAERALPWAQRMNDRAIEMTASAP